MFVIHNGFFTENVRYGKLLIDLAVFYVHYRIVIYYF